MKSTVCLHFRVVEQALIETSSTYLDAGELTDLIITQLTPIVEQGVSNESANLQESVDLQNFELYLLLTQRKGYVLAMTDLLYLLLPPLIGCSGLKNYFFRLTNYLKYGFFKKLFL